MVCEFSFSYICICIQVLYFLICVSNCAICIDIRLGRFKPLGVTAVYQAGGVFESTGAALWEVSSPFAELASQTAAKGLSALEKHRSVLSFQSSHDVSTRLPIGHRCAKHGFPLRYSSLFASRLNRNMDPHSCENDWRGESVVSVVGLFGFTTRRDYVFVYSTIS